MVLLDSNQGLQELQNEELQTETGSKKMTYNEWRQIRRRRKLLYQAPVCQTRLQSLEVQANYSIKLSVIITGNPTPSIIWTLDDEELEKGEKFTFEHSEADNKYSLVISQITPLESGCYQCIARNSEGTDSTIGFINVKEPKKDRRKRSVSRRPLISTIKEWKSREEPETDSMSERLLLRGRHCWNWMLLGAASSDDDLLRTREQSCDLDHSETDAKTEEEWERARLESQRKSTRCRSLPNMSNGQIVENKYAKLKSFWEKQRFRK